MSDKKNKNKKALKKQVTDYFKEKGLDFMGAKQMKTLGIESMEDAFVLTDEDIKDVLNPVQRRKFFNTVRQHPEYGVSQGSPAPTPTALSEDTSSPSRRSTGKARAMYDWKATTDEQLDVAEGEVVTVIDDAKNWWKVRNSIGNEGTVPSNYMKKVTGSGGSGGTADNIPEFKSAKPNLPEEEEECIYEPVKHKVEINRDFEGHDYEDPDALESSNGRKPVVRSEMVTKVPDAAPLPADPKTWMGAEVLRWLKQEDLKDFTDVFYANGFDGATLVTLHSSSFKAGGFDPDRCDKLQLALDKLLDKSKVKGKARALYDYDATKSTQLSFVEGDILNVLDDGGAWWKAKNSAGKKGTVPSNYLEMIPDNEAIEDKSPRGSSSASSNDIKSAPWFADTDRKSAERLLTSSKIVGGFLVRPSTTTPGDFTLTALGASGIMNLKIQKQPDGMYVLGQFSSRFTSIFELIEHHQTQQIRITGKADVLLTAPITA